jgi:RNA polymerase sigma-70 factor (ECF subfamily)
MDAEDAAQEVLLKVYTKIEDLKEPKAFNGWLNSILLHETRQVMIRNSKAGVVVSLADYLDSIEEDNAELLPLDYILREEERQTVMDVLEKLSIRQREAVLLHYFDNLNVSETAEVMGVTQQAVSLYLKLARNKIKAELSTSTTVTKPLAARLGAMPAGPLLALAMQQEAALVQPEDLLWAAQALEKLPELLTVAVTGSFSLKLFFGTAAGLAALIAIALGALSLADKPPAEVPDFNIISIEEDFGVEAIIDFTGGTNIIIESETNNIVAVNPTQAVASGRSDFGELKPIDWMITTSDNDHVLYNGSGNTALLPFSTLANNGPDGVYRIVFHMEDSEGVNYELSRIFIIDAAAKPNSQPRD